MLFLYAIIAYSIFLHFHMFYARRSKLVLLNVALQSVLGQKIVVFVRVLFSAHTVA